MTRGFRVRFYDVTREAAFIEDLKTPKASGAIIASIARTSAPTVSVARWCSFCPSWRGRGEMESGRRRDLLSLLEIFLFIKVSCACGHLPCS